MLRWTPGVCVSVCVSVCAFHLHSPKWIGQFLTKMSTNDLTNICQCQISRILTFQNNEQRATLPPPPPQKKKER